MITELIFKYLNSEATEEEIALVFEWIEKSDENKHQFFAIKKAWAISDFALDSNKKLAFEGIKKNLKKKERKRRNYWKYVAAILILICLTKSISLLIKEENTFENKIAIELSDGTTDYIINNEEKNILDKNGNIIGKQNANEIIYETNPETKEIAYNTLKIPFGKTYKVTLSDGTIVHLNSGTSFKYPIQFSTTQKRNVYLNGEAYFEVTTDEKKPFVVTANDIEIEVLGTIFNLNSYESDKTTHCELVEGLVRLSETKNTANNTLLTPNYKSTWDKKNKRFNVEAVDVKLYTAWVYGELIFINESFESLTKKLERTYGVKITNSNNKLNSQKFTGTIKIKESSIEDILDLLKLDTPFNYSKDDNTIEITNFKN